MADRRAHGERQHVNIEGRSNMHRIMVGGSIALGVLAVPPAVAADYPTKPVRVIVALAPGGGTDTSARLLAQKLADAFGQTFVVDNRPGAGALLGTELAAKAPADGYTLTVVSPEFTVNPSLRRNVPYEPLRDFAPIVRMTLGQYIVSVRPAFPPNSVKELIAYAKANPGQINFGSSGTGSANHLGGELFNSMAGVRMQHVPYKGAGPALAALLAGEVQVVFSSTTAVIGHVRAGRAKALAVTGPKRSPVVPEVPTVTESGLPGFEVTGWYGLLAPRKTPGEIIQRLNTQANRVLPDLRARFAELGSEVIGGTPDEFAAFIKADQEKWAKVIKSSGARAE
jgi:tripartite-type tricarboxylate transporter receptor subunit TctC